MKHSVFACFLGCALAFGRTDAAGADDDPPMARVSFEVTVPDDTPADAAVFLSGNHAVLGEWSGEGLALRRGGDGVFRGAVELPVGVTLEFKATRGGWDTVEKHADGTERENRRYVVNADGAVEHQLVVEAWRDAVDPPPAEAERAATQKKPEPTVVGDLRLHQVERGFGLPARTVRVWLPPGYEEAANAERRYPVLVMHDGQNLFDRATASWMGEWGVDETATALIEAGAIEPVIVVGIDNAGAGRIAEYMVKRVKVRDGLIIGGRGEAYARYVVERVLPMVDEAYRTDPAHEKTTSAGSSLGGNISLALLRLHPERFGQAAVMSPAMWVDAVNLIDRQVPELPRAARVWVDMGTAEGGENGPVYVSLARRLADQLDDHGIETRLRIVEGAAHTEPAWGARYGEVLTFLYGLEGAPRVDRSDDENSR